MYDEQLPERVWRNSLPNSTHKQHVRRVRQDRPPNGRPKQYIQTAVETHLARLARVPDGNGPQCQMEFFHLASAAQGPPGPPANIKGIWAGGRGAARFGIRGICGLFPICEIWARARDLGYG